MENASRHTKVNKGGRPKKDIKRDQQLGVLCSVPERKVIEDKAKEANLSVSEYLRDLALNSQIVRRQKTLPPEILQLSGRLNHIAANINQIAKKCNNNEALNLAETLSMQFLFNKVREVVVDIKNYFR